VLLLLIAAALAAVLATLSGQWARSTYYPYLKPLPLALLIATVLVTPQVPAKPALLLALFFGWLGDIALLFQRGFVPGLLAFLLGHLAMLWALWQLGAAASPLLITFSVAAAALMTFCLNPPAVLRAAVFVYALVLALVASLAVPLALTAPVWQLLLPASVLFLLSDTLLAWNKFRQPFAGAQLAILSSYFAAQGLFVFCFVMVPS
jgi:uncharacterized membrane protein YhhN